MTLVDMISDAEFSDETVDFFGDLVACRWPDPSAMAIVAAAAFIVGRGVRRGAMAGKLADAAVEFAALAQILSGLPGGPRLVVSNPCADADHAD